MEKTVLGGCTDPSMLTPVETAKFLNVSYATLEKWRYRKVGPTYYKVGRLIRYKESDLTTFLKEQRVEMNPIKPLKEDLNEPDFLDSIINFKPMGDKNV